MFAKICAVVELGEGRHMPIAEQYTMVVDMTMAVDMTDAVYFEV